MMMARCRAKKSMSDVDAQALKGLHGAEQKAFDSGLMDRFVEFTRALADALSAAIVDDNRQPLDDAALGKIRAQVQALYARMENQGIEAGSPLALRLFS